MSMSDPQAPGTPLRPPPRILPWLVIHLLCALFAATATPAQTVPASEGPTDGPAPAAAASDAAEDALEWPHFGLLRSRDLTPSGFLRLDMRPTHAYVARSGRWAFSLDLGYQNTWAVGGAADPYLESLSGRRELSPADWSAITAGGEACSSASRSRRGTIDARLRLHECRTPPVTTWPDSTPAISPCTRR